MSTILYPSSMRRVALVVILREDSLQKYINNTHFNLQTINLSIFRFLTTLLYIVWQAGIVESLDPLVKEFLAASDEDKKSALSKLDEEIRKLSGSAAK